MLKYFSICFIFGLCINVASAQDYNGGGRYSFPPNSSSSNNGSNGTITTIGNNASTATILNSLAILTGAPSTFTVATTGTTAGVIGIVTAGAGTTGDPTVQFNGIATCNFDAATTAGHLVGISSSVAGDCTDLGATPGTATVIGTVTSTTGSAGTASVILNPATTIALGATTCTPPAVVTAITSSGVACGSPAVPLEIVSSTGNTFTGPKEYAVCTAACTITPPIPVAGYEFCAFNANNTSGAITFAALGGSVRYQNSARTAYGAAGTGTLASSGATGDFICIIGLDSTHYITASSGGTITAS